MKRFLSFCAFFILCISMFAQTKLSTPTYDDVLEIINSGDINSLSKLISTHQIDLDGNENDVPYLFYACSNGDIDIVELLLSKGANPNLVTPYGTAAHWAAERGYINVIKLLIKQGFDPRVEEMAYWLEKSITDKASVPAWMIKVIGEINERNLPVKNYPYMEYTDPSDPLLLAASIMHDETLKLTKQLLKKGCNVNLIDKKGMTALHFSIQKMNSSAVKLLIKNGADVNQVIYSEYLYKVTHQKVFNNQLTPLHFVMYHVSSNPEVLAQHKAEVLEIITLLKQAGADVNAKTKDKKQTALDMAKKIDDNSIIDALTK